MKKTSIFLSAILLSTSLLAQVVMPANNIAVSELKSARADVNAVIAILGNSSPEIKRKLNESVLKMTKVIKILNRSRFESGDTVFYENYSYTVKAVSQDGINVTIQSGKYGNRIIIPSEELFLAQGCSVSNICVDQVVYYGEYTGTVLAISQDGLKVVIKGGQSAFQISEDQLFITQGCTVNNICVGQDVYYGQFSYTIRAMSKNGKKVVLQSGVNGDRVITRTDNLSL